jgi:predicted PurR-regulated permease PerM
MRVAFLLFLVIGITVLFGVMLRPFWMTLLLAAIFSALLAPVYDRLRRWLRGRQRTAAACTVVIFVILAVGPLLTILGLVAAEAFRISEAVRPWIEAQLAQPHLLSERLGSNPILARLAPYQETILEKAGELVGRGGRFIFDALSATTRGTVTVVVQFFILVYAMYFLLVDGATMLRKIVSYMPLEPDSANRMLEKFVSVSKATLRGTLVIGVLQGALAGVALAVAGIESAFFWGTVMTLLSVIPGVGSGLVWVPAAVYLFVTDHQIAGIALAAFCGLVVGSIDNLLRPRLVGQDVKMHDLMILFSTLGGLALFGFAGFIVGPILAALLVTVWDIYAIAFRDSLAVPVRPEIVPGERGAR